MKVLGGAKLRKQLGSLPRKARKHIRKAVIVSLNEGQDIAELLIAERSGETKNSIHIDLDMDGMGGKVVVGTDKKTAITGNVLEGGRRATAKTGAMAAQPFINPTRRYLRKKWQRRAKTALNKAVKEAARG